MKEYISPEINVIDMSTPVVLLNSDVDISLED